MPKYDVTNVENKDWVLHVQQSWSPIVLPPFCLRFPWHTDDVVKKALEESQVESATVVYKLLALLAARVRFRVYGESVSLRPRSAFGPFSRYIARRTYSGVG